MKITSVTKKLYLIYNKLFQVYIQIGTLILKLQND